MSTRKSSKQSRAVARTPSSVAIKYISRTREKERETWAFPIPLARRVVGNIARNKLRGPLAHSIPTAFLSSSFSLSLLAAESAASQISSETTIPSRDSRTTYRQKFPWECRVSWCICSYPLRLGRSRIARRNFDSLNVHARISEYLNLIAFICIWLYSPYRIRDPFISKL